MSAELWVEKYRPATLADYVWVDPTMQAIVERWIADGALPHCLFSGTPGTGKTSLAKLLLRILQIPTTDVLYVNASRERHIDVVQDSIVNFVPAWALGTSGIKYVLLDEADKLSKLSQDFLRNEMETYWATCRFILTANAPQNISPAIHSRVQELRFPSLNRDDFTLRVADVLQSENITFEPQNLLDHVQATFPDLRKCINLTQRNSRNGVLGPFKAEDSSVDYLQAMFALIKQGKYMEARKLIYGKVHPDEYEDMFRAFYQNIAMFGRTENDRDEAIVIIRNGLLNHRVIAAPEINLEATLIELSRINRPNL